MIRTLFCLFSLLLVAPVQAATYYVATTGNNSNAGSVGSPWLTMQHAADVMVAGDTVNVAAGTYAARVNVATSGTSSNPITYQASGTVITQGFKIQASYIKVIGFEITNSNAAYGNGIGVYVAGTHNEITSNYVHDLYWEGIWLFGENGRDDPLTANNLVNLNTIVRARVACVMIEGQNNIVDSNDCSHTIQYPAGAPARSGADADGMRFFGVGHIIKRNTIHDIVGTDPGQVDPHTDCFQTWGPASNITVAQNTCYGEPANLQLCQCGNSEAPVHDLTFRNNLFYSGTRGVNLAEYLANGPIYNIAVTHNTFADVETQALVVRSDNRMTIKNNLFYNVGSDLDAYVDGDAGMTGIAAGYNAMYSSAGVPFGSPYTGDLWDINPLVVNSGSRNYHLQSGSPLRDAAIGTPGTTGGALVEGGHLGIDTPLLSGGVDHDDVTRPYGPRSDIGAFEYHP